MNEAGCDKLQPRGNLSGLKSGFGNLVKSTYNDEILQQADGLQR
jgi:hypothetical protein